VICIEQRVVEQGCPGMKGWDPVGKPWFKALATDHKGNPATAERGCPWDAAAEVVVYLRGRLEVDSRKAARQ
jgi:hypothetical protein